jgi:hypothetical protein
MFAILTPFIMPFESKKPVNFGDGFILQAILNAVTIKPLIVISTRCNPTPNEIEALNKCQFALIAGSNLANQQFQFLGPDTASAMKQINCPIIPVGVGLGDGIETIGDFSKAGLQNLSLLLERLAEYQLPASWRCFRTKNLMDQVCSKLGFDVEHLMTGCPTMFQRRLASPSELQQILISTTIRDDFLERELELLESAVEFSRIRELPSPILYFQQPLNPSANFRWKAFQQRKSIKQLIDISRKLGVELFEPKSLEECFWKFANTSFHCGSRLHTHITFRASNKPSLLQAIDNRAIDYGSTFKDECVITNRNINLQDIERAYGGTSLPSFSDTGNWALFLKKIGLA